MGPPPRATAQAMPTNKPGRAAGKAPSSTATPRHGPGAAPTRLVPPTGGRPPRSGAAPTGHLPRDPRCHPRRLSPTFSIGDPVLTLHERHSRRLIAARPPGKAAAPIAHAIAISRPCPPRGSRVFVFLSPWLALQKPRLDSCFCRSDRFGVSLGYFHTNAGKRERKRKHSTKFFVTVRL